MSDFYAGLCDVLNASLKEATRLLEVERVSNAGLRNELAAIAPHCSEMQDRITTLELELSAEIARRKEQAAPPSDAEGLDIPESLKGQAS